MALLDIYSNTTLESYLAAAASKAALAKHLLLLPRVCPVQFFVPSGLEHREAVGQWRLS